jgi:hypothetical protein
MKYAVTWFCSFRTSFKIPKGMLLILYAGSQILNIFFSKYLLQFNLRHWQYIRLHSWNITVNEELQRIWREAVMDHLKSHLRIFLAELNKTEILRISVSWSGFEPITHKYYYGDMPLHWTARFYFPKHLFWYLRIKKIKNIVFLGDFVTLYSRRNLATFRSNVLSLPWT